MGDKGSIDVFGVIRILVRLRRLIIGDGLICILRNICILCVLSCIDVICDDDA